MKIDTTLQTLSTEDDNKTTNTNQEYLINSETDQHESTPKPKKCSFLELNPGVSYFNLVTYYLVNFSWSCVFTFAQSCQDYLLKHPDYYNIDPAEKGTINGDLLLYSSLYLVKYLNYPDSIYIHIWLPSRCTWKKDNDCIWIPFNGLIHVPSTHCWFHLS
jgi:hypothetical protein